MISNPGIKCIRLLLIAIVLPVCLAEEFVSVDLNPGAKAWALPHFRTLLNHDTLILVDGPASVERLTLPEPFGDPSDEMSWGPLPHDPGPRGRWLAWGMPEPGTIRLVRLSPDGLTLDLPEVELPQDCKLFTFLAWPNEPPQLIALMDQAIVGVSLDDATFGDQKPLLERDGILGAFFPSLGMPVYVEWNMDLDQDGRDDMLIITERYIDVYRRTEDKSLTHTARTDGLDKKLPVTDMRISTRSGFPLPAFSTPELWLEPVLHTSLPALCLGEYRWRAVWEQTSPGVFGQRKLVELGPDGVDTRDVTRCRLYAGGPEGLATSETLWSQGWPLSRMMWAAPGASVPPLTVKRSVLAIDPVDIDRDGTVEFLVADLPAMRKALAVLAQGMLKNLEIKWSFVRWNDRRSSWVQASKSFPMKTPVSEHGSARSTIFRLSETSIVGNDFNGDGVGDVAWLGEDNHVELRLLHIQDGIIDVAAPYRVPVSDGTDTLKAVDTNFDDVYEILAVASSQDDDVHGLDQGMREYQLVYYRN